MNDTTQPNEPTLTAGEAAEVIRSAWRSADLGMAPYDELVDFTGEAFKPFVSGLIAIFQQTDVAKMVVKFDTAFRQWAPKLREIMRDMGYPIPPEPEPSWSVLICDDCGWRSDPLELEYGQPVVVDGLGDRGCQCGASIESLRHIAYVGPPPTEPTEPTDGDAS